MIEGGRKSEKNLPAEKAPEKDGARIPEENGDGKWKKGPEEKTRKGQSKTDLLSFRLLVPQPVADRERVKACGASQRLTFL